MVAPTDVTPLLCVGARVHHAVATFLAFAGDNLIFVNINSIPGLAFAGDNVVDKLCAATMIDTTGDGQADTIA